MRRTHSLDGRTSAMMYTTRLPRLIALVATLTVATSQPGVAMNCECVPFFQCDDDNRIITSGANIFDVKNRLGEVRVFNVSHANCPADDNGVGMKCCEIPPDASPEDTQPPVNERHQEFDQHGDTRLCGTRGGSAVDSTAQRISAGQAGDATTSFGEFPWMLVLMKKASPEGGEIFKCGASLIHSRVALTAAHCVNENMVPSSYLVRAGEYDITSKDEALPYQDRDVEEILVPHNFNPKALYHDTALLHLGAPFELDDHIVPICLPEAAELFDGEACIATGWGRPAMAGAYSSVLRKVDLRMVARSSCQTALRKTRLGRYFLLDQSFVCAEGQLGADTCDGDGGSPLICPLRSDPLRWAQVGVTAWGIGCGDNIPSVYASVARSREWIDQQLLNWGYGVNNDLDVSPRVAMAIETVFNTKS